MPTRLALPVCQMCFTPVEGRTVVIEQIFVEGGEEQTCETVTLSCGCVIQFPSYDVDVRQGQVTLKNSLTGETILNWADDEMLYEDDCN